MAKKKSETEDAKPKAAAKKPPVAKKEPAPKKAARTPAPAVGGGTPMVDTSLAAQTAARMLTARAKMNAAARATGSGGEDKGMLAQIKETLNKPAGLGGGAASSVLGPTKTDLPIQRDNQSFHSQTQGAGRVNVPRRTAG